MGGHPGLRGHAPFKVAAPLEDVIWVESVDRQWHDFWDCFPGAFSLEDADATGSSTCAAATSRRSASCVTATSFELGDAAARGRADARAHPRPLRLLRARDGPALQRRRRAGLRDCPRRAGRASSRRSTTTSTTTSDGLERLRALPFTKLCPAHHLPARPRRGPRADRSQHRVHRRDGQLVAGPARRAPTDR